MIELLKGQAIIKVKKRDNKIVRYKQLDIDIKYTQADKGKRVRNRWKERHVE